MDWYLNGYWTKGAPAASMFSKDFVNKSKVHSIQEWSPRSSSRLHSTSVHVPWTCMCIHSHSSFQFYRNPLFQQYYRFNLCAHTLSTNYESFSNPLNHHRHVVSALLCFLVKWGYCSQKEHLGLSVTQCGSCYDAIIISTLTRTWNFSE